MDFLIKIGDQHGFHKWTVDLPEVLKIGMVGMSMGEDISPGITGGGLMGMLKMGDWL